MNCHTGSVLDSVTEQLLKEVEHSYKSTGQLTDELLTALQFVFQTTLSPALDLVDHRNITRISSPCGRVLYQVVGSSGTPYTCLSTSIYCSCPAYRYSVLMKQDHIMCKHTLAIRLAVAMDLCKELVVTNEELVKVITNMDWPQHQQQERAWDVISTDWPHKGKWSRSLQVDWPPQLQVAWDAISTDWPQQQKMVIDQGCNQQRWP